MIEIRLCRRDEIPRVLDLWAEATDLRATDTAEALEHLVDREALLIALDGDEIIGTIVAGWDGWRGNIYRLAVHPKFRRQGIGTALVAEAEERFRAAGAARMSMLVDTDDPEATAFWRSLGGVGLDEGVRRYIKDLP